MRKFRTINVIIIYNIRFEIRDSGLITRQGIIIKKFGRDDRKRLNI